MDRLSLTGLSVDCIVGVYPTERERPQPLMVDISLGLDTRPAAIDGRLRDTVDSARLWGEIRFLLTASRFALLESAAEAVARYVLLPPSADAPRGRVEEVTVRLAKPHALAGAGLPALEIQRKRSELTVEVEPKKWGAVDVVFVTSGCGVYRLRVAPGATIPTHVHREMDESELVLGAGLLLQGNRVQPGTAFRWPRGFAHRYDNPGPTEQSILCVDRPRFIPEDEVEVSGAPHPLGELEPTSYFA